MLARQAQYTVNEGGKAWSPTQPVLHPKFQALCSLTLLSSDVCYVRRTLICHVRRTLFPVIHPLWLLLLLFQIILNTIQFPTFLSIAINCEVDVFPEYIVIKKCLLKETDCTPSEVCTLPSSQCLSVCAHWKGHWSESPLKST